MWPLCADHWLCRAPVDSFQREEDAHCNFRRLQQQQQQQKPEHALSHEGIPTDHTAGIKQLQEATPVRSALGKGPAQGHSQVINGEDRRAGLRLRRCVLGLA